MTAGARKFRATFEEPVSMSDGAGGFVISWTPIGERWVEVRQARPAPSDEVETEARQVQVLDHTVIVRDDPDTRRIASTWRVTIGGRVLAIRAVGFPICGQIVLSAQEGVAP